MHAALLIALRGDPAAALVHLEAARAREERAQARAGGVRPASPPGP